MAYRPGVIGSGGYQRMKIGEATRLAMGSETPSAAANRAKLGATGSAKDLTSDLEAETKQLLAAIRGTGSLSKAKLSKTDSSIKT